MEVCYSGPVIKRFFAFLKSNRLAHAYLFIGPSQIGKSITAMTVAKLVNCENLSDGYPCKQCSSCIRIDKGNHPDVYFLAADESGTIKIEQIRHIITRIQLRPYEAKRKVFIIKDADQLTVAASNALLKTLEEPSGNSLILLTTSLPERMFSTIKSRCQTVRFFGLGAQQLKDKLMESGLKDENVSHFLSFFSEGNIGFARRMSSTKFFKRKNEIIDNVVLTKNSDLFLNKIVTDKEKTKEVLRVLLSFFRDVILLKAGIGHIQLVHKDRVVDLQKIQRRLSFEQADACLQEIIKATKILEENLNIKIAISLIKEKLWPRS